MFNLEVTLIYGDIKLTWLRLSAVLMAGQPEKLVRVLQATGHGTSAIAKVSDLWVKNIAIKAGTPETTHKAHIFDLVSSFSTYGCTDPHDRVFALYSMAHENCALMEINYHQNIQTMYQGFAFACMNDGQRGTRVLVEALARPKVATSVAWPSWVPDWRVKRSTYPEYLPLLGGSHGNGLPNVLSANALSDDEVELSLEYLCLNERLSPSDDGMLHSITVSTTSTVSMDDSITDFLLSIGLLYRRSTANAQRPQDASQLGNLLLTLWNIIPPSPNNIGWPGHHQYCRVSTEERWSTNIKAELHIT